MPATSESAPTPPAAPSAPAIAAAASPAHRRRLSLAAQVALVELALTALEVLLVAAPLVELATPALRATGLGHKVAPVLAALLALCLLRAADRLRPVLAARATKRLGQPVAAAEMEAAQRAIARAPAETALLRWALWVGAAVYVAVRLVRE